MCVVRRRLPCYDSNAQHAPAVGRVNTSPAGCFSLPGRTVYPLLCGEISPARSLWSLNTRRTSVLNARSVIIRSTY